MKMNPKTVKSLVLIWVLGLLYSAPLRAQVSGATLSGAITDAQGGAVAGAKVSVRNLGTGIAVDTTTNDTGAYGVPNLAPADYEVSVTAAGFSTTTSRVTLTVGAKQEMNIKLTVGQVSQTVEVTGAALQVDMATSTISGNVVGNEVRELPLNGRDWTSLATLQPGVTSVRSQIPVNGAAPQGSRGLGMHLTISGNRSTQNSYRLDGAIVNDYSNAGPGSVLGQNLGVDAIQEFSVLTSNYSSEYGFTSGGVVNAVTRSGTNSYHGTAFDFVRNDKFDAANFFDNANGLHKAVLRQNQFGGSLGGPVIKDKIFAFGDYEGIRYVKGSPMQNVTISDDIRNGDVHNLGAVGHPITHTAIDPLILGTPGHSFLNSFWPEPTPGAAPILLSDGTVNQNAGFFNWEGVNRASEDFYTLKADFKISSKDSLAGTFVHDISSLTFPTALNLARGINTSYRETAILEETHIFSAAFVNSVRVAVSRTRSNQFTSNAAVNPAVIDPTLEQVPGFAGFGPPSVGLSGTGITGIGGLLPQQHQDYGLQMGQIYNDAFYTRGNHTFKFGGSVFRMWNFAMVNQKAGGDGSGTFSGANSGISGGNGGAILNFLQNKPSQANRYADYTNAFKRYTRANIAGGYFQDDWRFRPSLTLNLGVRYEMMSNPQEKYGRIAFLSTPFSDPGAINGSLCAGSSCVGNPGLVNGGPNTPFTNAIRARNVTLKNFVPRIGFAWDPQHNGKTAVRGGFGMFDVLPLAYMSSINLFEFPLFPNAIVVGAPFASSITPGTWPYSIPALADTKGTTANSQYGYVDQNIKRNYVYQYNLNIQRQVTPSTTLTVAYVGSHGVHNPSPQDAINGAIPQNVAGVGDVFPIPWTYCTGANAPAGNGCTVAGLGTNAKPNTHVGIIQAQFWQAMSYYNGLQVNVSKKMSHDFQVQGAFTWSKSIDTSSTSFGDTYQNTTATTEYYNITRSKGPSDFNIKRALTINALWNAHTPKTLGAFGDRALGGWQLGTIISASDGIPFWPMVGEDSAQGSDMLGEQVVSFNPATLLSGCSPVNTGSALKASKNSQYVNLSCFGLVQQNAANMAINPATGVPYCDFGRAAAMAAAAGVSGVPGLATSCPNIRGGTGRNIFNGPGLVNVDFSVFKNNYIPKISEVFNVQFRAEFFNVFNRANFGLPNIPSTATGMQLINNAGTYTQNTGQINATQTPGRIIQFALKMIW